MTAGVNVAGWLKLRHALFQEPEVVCIAQVLGLSVETTVGSLARVWGWVDQHVRDTASGQSGVPPTFFDELVGIPGFVAALCREAPHWAEVTDAGRVQFHNFGRHNGPGAKAHATDAQRKMRARAAREPVHREALARSFVLPDWIPADLWADFLDVRTKKRAPATIRAFQLLVKHLDERRAAGDSVAAVLEQSIARGYTGVFPVARAGADGKSPPARYVPPPKTPETPEEIAFAEHCAAASRRRETRLKTPQGG